MTKEPQEAIKEAKPMNVYQAIACVTARLAKEGISKDRKNEQQGYKFRGIDDVYNALAPFLAESRLCILPNVLSREAVEKTTKTGGVLFYVTVQVRFDFVSADDGTTHQVVTYGEAMDSGDKATNKAMSAAYKYACMQAFCIPTEGDNDADSKTHELKADPAIETEEAVEIDLLLNSKVVDRPAFMAYFKIDDVRKLKQRDFATAKAMLEKKADKVVAA